MRGRYSLAIATNSGLKNVSVDTEGAISFQFCSISLNTWRNKLFSIIKLSYQINDCECPELRPAHPWACMNASICGEKYLETGEKNNEKTENFPNANQQQHRN